MTPHILIVFLFIFALVGIVALWRAPDRPVTILNRKGLPRTFPEPDADTAESQTRRDKVR